MVMGGMANMQGQAAFAQAITPQNFGAPIQPMAAPQPTQSPFASALQGAQQIWGGYGAVTGQMPGSMGQQQALDQMQMTAAGLVAGPMTPFPVNQLFTGMQQQAVLNRTLEQNFQFVRPGGRGFTGTQQLAVGAGMNQIAAQTPFVGMGELTQLMGQGAQLGQYQGLRDATAVIKRTRELMKDWRDIAVELNTTMSEAQQIMGQVKQLGIFRPGQQRQAIQGMATTAAMTGIGIQQQMAMGAAGAQMAPQLFGQGVGVRAAGAAAMLSQLQMVGVAARAGVLSEEQIFEATGQSGEAGRMALAQRLNVSGARFMRRGRGKVTMAAFVDPDTMQIDDDMVQRFMSGNMGLGEIERRARQNASKMGYVKWRANRGRMAAAFTEETAGLGHLALMRSFLGEGVMEDTERSRLILAKQTGMSQSEIDAVMPMLRELPMLQNRMRNETRMVSKQREQAQRWNQYGPQAQWEKQKDKMRQAVLGPIDDLRMGMQQAFTQAFEDAINEATGQNEQVVGQATRDIMDTMIRGGVGARGARERFQRAQGVTGQLEAFRGGTAQLQGIVAGQRPVGVLEQVGAGFERWRRGGLMLGLGGALGTGLRTAREMGLGGFYRGAMGDLQQRAAGLTGRLGRYLAGKSVEEMERGMARAGSESLAKAYNTGIIGPNELKELGLSSGDFEKYVRDDRIAQALVSGGGLQEQVERIKGLSGNEGMTDEQAKAVIAKVSKQKDFLADIEFLSPKGQAVGKTRSMQDAMKDYIAANAALSKGGTKGEMEATASQWINNSKLQRMVSEGESISAIMAEAKGMGGESAASFMQAALTARKDPATGKMITEETLRKRFKTAGDIQLRIESDEAIRKAYLSQAEDFATAAGTGRFRETMTAERARLADVGAAERKAGGRRLQLMGRYQELFKKYDLEGGVKDQDMAAFQQEISDINTQILSQSPGDVDATVAMMRRAGMGTAANQLETAMGIQRDIRKGTLGQARARGARFLLGGKAGGFEDLLSQKGMSDKERYEKIALRMAEEGYEQEDINRIKGLAGAGKEDVNKLVAKQASDLATFEAAQQKEAEAQKEQDTQDKRATYKNVQEIATDINYLANKERGKGGERKIKVRVDIGKDPQEMTNADVVGEEGAG
jgi:hypothetical protein